MSSMILFYLQRATTPGCWTCHQWDDVSIISGFADGSKLGVGIVGYV